MNDVIKMKMTIDKLTSKVIIEKVPNDKVRITTFNKKKKIASFIYPVRPLKQN